MFNYYGAARRLSKDLRACLNEREMWKARALALEKKLESRSDFFIEREMKLVDRFLTSQVKTFAITDEIKASKVTDQDVKDAELSDFLAEKKEFLISCAREAGIDHPETTARRESV